MKKKINKKEVSVLERHFGVVLEDIDSKLDIVVEGHQALDKKIEDFKKRWIDVKHQSSYSRVMAGFGIFISWSHASKDLAYSCIPPKNDKRKLRSVMEGKFSFPR